MCVCERALCHIISCLFVFLSFVLVQPNEHVSNQNAFFMYALNFIFIFFGSISDCTSTENVRKSCSCFDDCIWFLWQHCCYLMKNVQKKKTSSQFVQNIIFFFLQKRTINQLILLIWIQYFTINERNESYWWQCTHLKIVQRNWILIHSYVGFELLFFVRQIVLKVYLSYFGYWCHSEQQSQW